MIKLIDKELQIYINNLIFLKDKCLVYILICRMIEIV